jgi:hypothetical protein
VFNELSNSKLFYFNIIPTHVGTLITNNICSTILHLIPIYEVIMIHSVGLGTSTNTECGYKFHPGLNKVACVGIKYATQLVTYLAMA